MLTPESVVVAARDVTSSDLPEGAVVVHPGSGTCYGLNAVGARVWQLVQLPRAVKSVQEAIRAEYDVDAGQAERDVLALLQQLEAEGLIEVTGPATP